MAKKNGKKGKGKLSSKKAGLDKSRRLSQLSRHPNPPRRSVKSGRKGEK